MFAKILRNLPHLTPVLPIAYPIISIYCIVNLVKCQDYTNAHACYNAAREFFLNNNTIITDTANAQFSAKAWDHCLTKYTCSEDLSQMYKRTITITLVAGMYFNPNFSIVFRQLGKFKDGLLEA